MTEVQKFPDAPEGSSPTTIALWPEVQKAHDSIVAAVEAASKIAGTMGEFVTRANAEVDSFVVRDIVALWQSADKDRTEMTVADFVSGIDSMRGEVLANLSGGLDAKREAASETYKSALADYDAARRFIKDDAAVAILDAIVLPDLPGKSRAKTTATTTGETKTYKVRYWRQPTGKAKTPQPDSQNKVSSLASYYGGGIAGKSKPSESCTTEQLEAFAKQAGIDVKQTGTAWELEVPGFGKIGMDVLD